LKTLEIFACSNGRCESSRFQKRSVMNPRIHFDVFVLTPIHHLRRFLQGDSADLFDPDNYDPPDGVLGTAISLSNPSTNPPTPSPTPSPLDPIVPSISPTTSPIVTETVAAAPFVFDDQTIIMSVGSLLVVFCVIFGLVAFLIFDDDEDFEPRVSVYVTPEPSEEGEQKSEKTIKKSTKTHTSADSKNVKEAKHSGGNKTSKKQNTQKKKKHKKDHEVSFEENIVEVLNLGKSINSKSKKKRHRRQRDSIVDKDGTIREHITKLKQQAIRNRRKHHKKHMPRSRSASICSDDGQSHRSKKPKITRKVTPDKKFKHKRRRSSISEDNNSFKSHHTHHHHHKKRKEVQCSKSKSPGKISKSLSATSDDGMVSKKLRKRPKTRNKSPNKSKSYSDSEDGFSDVSKDHSRENSEAFSNDDSYDSKVYGAFLTASLKPKSNRKRKLKHSTILYE